LRQKLGYTEVVPENQDNLRPDSYPDCPGCSRNAYVIPIFYGLRSPDAIQLAGQGAAELGGYFQKPDAPAWRCKACGQAFRVDQ
jgi:hypothetical protein